MNVYVHTGIQKKRSNVVKNKEIAVKLERVMKYSNTKVQKGLTHTLHQLVKEEKMELGVWWVLSFWSFQKLLYSLCQAHKTAGV